MLSVKMNLLFLSPIVFKEEELNDEKQINGHPFSGNRRCRRRHGT